NTLAEEKEEAKYFSAFNVVAVVVAVFLLAYNFTPNPSRFLSLGFGITLVVLIALPIAVPVKGIKIAALNKADIEQNQVGDGVEQPLLIEQNQEESVADVVPAETEEEFVEKRKPVIGEEHTIMEALSTVDFWILFVSFLCGVGTGLVV
ncbi:hypothetical protein LINPERHAP2_LOCUS30515, partial [Linum perenne]